MSDNVADLYTPLTSTIAASTLSVSSSDVVSDVIGYGAVSASYTATAAITEGVDVAAGSGGGSLAISQPYLFEVPIRGLDSGMRLELVLPLAWEEPIGAAPVAVPYGPANGSLDALRIEATFWVEATAAVALEANAPPYGDNDATMILPVVAGGLAIPGVAGTTPVAGFRQFAVIASDDSDEAGFGSEGRHFDGMDLIDYTLSALIPCDQVVTSFSTTVPAAVARQLGKHSWKDWSVHHIGSTTSGGVRSYASNARQQSGRRWKGKVPCKGLTISQADALIQWVRALRGAAAEFPSYLFGPSFAGRTVTIVVRSLTMEHHGGHLWDAELETYLASSA